MAIYHFRAQIIKRNEGRSAVAAVAYRSASKLHSVYDDKEYDFTNKRFVEYSEISLPEHAPQTFYDREVLWNTVEMSEKAKDAQLAREFEISLPIELGIEQNIELARKFVNEVFVDEGMIVDWSLHNPAMKDDLGRCLDKNGEATTDVNEYIYNNPHIHIMTVLRPLNADGSFANKTEVEYKCIKNGEERGFTASEYAIVKEDGWQKQYRYYDEHNKKVWLTTIEATARGLKRVNKYPKTTKGGRKNEIVERWNSTDELKNWRKSWEEYVNAKFIELGIDERIDSRSFKEQGRTEEIPKFYIGREAYNYEKKLKRLQKEGKKVIHTDVKQLYDMTTDYNNTAKRYNKEIDENVNELVIVSENIRCQIIRNEYALSSLCNDLSNINNEIQSSTDNYNNYQAELNDSINRYEALCNKLTMLNQKVSSRSINIVRHRNLIKEQKEIQKQIKVLENYIEYLKSVYGDTYNKEAVTLSDEKKTDELKVQIDSINAENCTLIKDYHNLMKDADVDIEDIIKIKIKQLKILENSLQNEYQTNFNKYEFDRIKRKVDRILEIKEDTAYKKVRTR